jgi:chitinase
MDEPLETAYRYNAVVAAADGSLWSSTPAPALPVVTVSAADGAAAEAGRDSGMIRFIRSGGDLTTPLTVNYTVGGTATAGGDYERLLGAVTFAAGATTADVMILPIDDITVERPESVTVTLSAGTDYAPGSTLQGEVTISSDDVAVVPTVGIASAAVMEGNGGRRLIAFTLSLSTATTETVTVRWSTANGTATAGRDYLAISGVATFRPGQRTATANVWVLGDRVKEGNETFFVKLSSPSKATLSPTARTATGMIFNDDGLSRSALAAAFASLDAFNSRPRR